MSERRTSIPTHRSSADASGQLVLPGRRNRTSSSPLVQALRDARGDIDTTAVNQVVQSAGDALDDQSRQFFESRFGHDFSRVRIHADQRAGEAADRLQAEAYTAGTHMVFATGRYEPQTERGRLLLAHELAHVAQQGAGTVNSGYTQLSRPDSFVERTAESSARRVVGGLAPTALPHAEAGVIYRTI